MTGGARRYAARNVSIAEDIFDLAADERGGARAIEGAANEP